MSCSTTSHRHLLTATEHGKCFPLPSFIYSDGSSTSVLSHMHWSPSSIWSRKGQQFFCMFLHPKIVALTSPNYFFKFVYFVVLLRKEKGIRIFCLMLLSVMYSKLIISYVSKCISLWTASLQPSAFFDVIWVVFFNFFAHRELPVPHNRLEKSNYLKHNWSASSLPWIC